MTQLHSKQMLIVNSRSRNGLIIYKGYHAEFAGPGAAVGNLLDMDCCNVLPVGNLELINPENAEERLKAYRIRWMWIWLISRITKNSLPLKRAQMILNQFEGCFDTETVAKIPDESFALMVGVFPQTIWMVRPIAERLDCDEK